MGLKKTEDLIELKNSKKKLIDFLWRKERSIYDIRKNLNVSQRRVNQIVTELNDIGILMHHNVNYTKFFRLERNKISVKHETDKFRSDVAFLIGALVVSIILSSYVFFSFWFMGGATFSVMVIFGLTLYKIFKTTDVTRYFYKPTKSR